MRYEFIKQSEDDKLSPKELIVLAQKIWKISKELGSEAADIPPLLKIYSRARDEARLKHFLLMCKDVRNLPKEMLKLIVELEQKLLKLESIGKQKKETSIEMMGI